MTSVVTKTGDEGQTGLFGGKRIGKDDVRLHAYGTVDELNAYLGVVLEHTLPADVHEHVSRLQHLLFRAGADLATPADAPLKAVRMREQDVTDIEQWITNLEAKVPPQKVFLLPGGSPAAAALHVCRTICRRAERWVVSLERTEPVTRELRIFLNRASDYLFLAARHVLVEAKKTEVEARYD